MTICANMTGMKLDKLIKGNKINFKCLNSGCPQNCCGPNFKNAEGMIKARAIFDVQKNTVPLTSEEAGRVVAKHGRGKVSLVDGAGYHLACTKENGCVFFNRTKNMCSIYSDNFASCKSYPFFFDKYWGLCIDETCPGVGAGWTDMSEASEMIDNLIIVYENQFSAAREYARKLK